MEEQPRVEFDSRRPSLFTLTYAFYSRSVCATHSRRDVPPSRNELVAACGECGDCRRSSWHGLRFVRFRLIRTLKRCGDRRSSCFRFSSRSFAWAFAAFLTRVAWGRNAAQPELPMVVSTVAHVAVGALLLATTVVLAIQVWRHVPVAFEERVAADAAECFGRMRRPRHFSACHFKRGFVAHQRIWALREATVFAMQYRVFSSLPYSLMRGSYRRKLIKTHSGTLWHRKSPQSPSPHPELNSPPASP